MGGWTYDSGQFNLYCDVCKRKIKAGEAKHRWDGFIVCPDDWEPRQPQDFVKAKIDKIMVPFSRPTEDTANNIQYGDYDIVTFTEDILIGISKHLDIMDTYTISEVEVIGTVDFLDDTFTVGELFSITTGAYLDPLDTVPFDDYGYFYLYDYTTPSPPDPQTYFAEDYVGLLVNF